MGTPDFESRLGRISIKNPIYHAIWTAKGSSNRICAITAYKIGTGFFMRQRRVVIAALLSLVAVYGAKKKKADDTTQTLDLPKYPPMVAIGETRRLIFNVSPLSTKGLLSQQTRDALKTILKMNGGVPVIHIRAFVSGSGDLRRVPQIVSEMFTEKKLPLPSVSVVQAGGLPLENAQVVIETVSAGKKGVNPDGLMFVEAQRAETLEKSMDQLVSRLGGATALRVSCFV